MTKSEFELRLSIFVLLVGLFSTASAQDNDKVIWSITPYLWASDTVLDLSVQETNISDGAEISFDDLVDTLDAALQIQVEGGVGNWSGFGDLTYISTSDDNTEPLLVTDAKNKQLLIDIAAAYWPAGVGTNLNVYGGLRYSGFDDRYRFTLGDLPLVEVESKKDYYDALLGIRYRFDLSKRWALLTRGDVSFGDSEGTFLVRGLFAYTVGKRQQNRIVFGYEYKEAEYEDGGLTTEFTLSGPMAGFNFKF
jgi:hypothetical protein